MTLGKGVGEGIAGEKYKLGSEADGVSWAWSKFAVCGETDVAGGGVSRVVGNCVGGFAPGFAPGVKSVWLVEEVPLGHCDRFVANSGIS